MEKEGVLAGVVGAVGNGDLEEGLEDVDQDMVVVGADAVAVGVEEAGDLAGIGVKTRDVLAGKVVDPGGVLFLALGEGEDAAEGGDLVAGHGAVGLGHLGTKREDGDGEADGVFRRGIVAQAVEDHGQGLALGEGGEGLGNAGPDRHGGTLSRRMPDVRGISASAQGPCNDRT